jgi:electron transfer flavoprotein beta subunit
MNPIKIIVVFKWLKNPEDAHVGSDGSVDWRGAKMAVSDDDPAAVQVARELADAGGEIIGLTIGDGDAAWAAARGASSTVIVTDAQSNADAAATATALVAAVRRIGGADLVLIGDSSWDYGVSVALAGQLGWTALAGVSSAKLDGERLLATRKFGDSTQIIEVARPAVLAVSANRAEQNPPGMKEVLAARKKPQTKLTLADLGVTQPEGVTSRGTKLPDTAPAKIIDGADPVAAAAQIVAALRTEGVL